MEDSLQMLTQNEVAQLLHVHKDHIAMLRDTGVLLAIKTGKNFMFSKEEIKRFQHDYAGLDVSNRTNALQSCLIVNQKRNEHQPFL